MVQPDQKMPRVESGLGLGRGGMQRFPVMLQGLGQSALALE